MILQHGEMGHFSTIWLISPESDRIFLKFLLQLYPWTGKSPLCFGSNPDTESVSGYGLLLQTILSLAEVCGL